MFSQQQQELIRKEFSHISSNYFNTAYFGPSPYRAKQKVNNALFKELDPSFFLYHTWMGIPDRLRSKIAALLDCSMDSIAHGTSVTDFVSTIAQTFPFKPGDIVVSMDHEYPSNVLPWMLAQKQGRVEFKLLEHDFPSVEYFKKHLPPQTKVVNISHVSFDTGRRVDLLSLGKYFKEQGIFFIVDATQSLGGLEITSEELQNIDVLVCSTYKWLLGAYGHAFAYFSDSALNTLERITGNWIASPNSREVYNLLNYTTETLPGARKFDRGQTPNMLTMSCLEASLDLLNEVGLKSIQDHNAHLRNYFLDHYPKKKYKIITPLDTPQRSHILSLHTESIDPLQLEIELRHKNFDVSVRQGKVRLSFHLFNTSQQVEELINTLDA